MQQQHQSPNERDQINLTKFDANDIINAIKQTYSGKSTQSVKKGEDKILKFLDNNLKAIQILFQFIKPPYQMDRNFRNACGNLLKKVYYRVSQGEAKKEPYLRLGYEILVATNYQDHRIKQNISIGLQYIFNKDQQNVYKDDCMKHAKVQMLSLIDHPEAWTIQTIEVIHGLLLLFISYLHSLVQPQHQIQFVNNMLPTFCRTASLCAQFAQSNLLQSVEARLLFLASTQIFQFIQLSAQRLLQQKQYLPDEIDEFESQQSLTNIMIEYLHLYCQQNSIVTKYPILNQIKLSILQILYQFTHHQSHIDQNIIQIIFLQFMHLLSAKKDNTDDNDDDDDGLTQQIDSKIMAILQNQMANKKHQTFFNHNKMQIMLVLLAYCQTGAEQLQYMIEQPQKFVQSAQQFTQAFSTSPYLKIRAANFIRTFVKQFDEGLSQLVELCVILVVGSVNITGLDSQVLRQSKQVFASFQFMNFGWVEKLDIAFMVLALLADKILERKDLYLAVTSMLMTNFNAICKITEDLVILRLIRLIGYMPNALYFPFIQNCMGFSRVFTLEGLSCFDRISKNKQYLQTFPLIHLTYDKISDFIIIGDPIFERLVHQNYENILKKNDGLYQKILLKIYNSFEQAVHNLQMQGSKQKSITCLNYIQKMMRGEKSQKYLTALEQIEQQMQHIGINISLLQQNFISIYQTLISKQILVNAKIQKFVYTFSDSNKLHHYPNYSQYFKLLNKFIVKSDCFQVIQMIYNNLINYIGETGKDKYNYAIVPQLMHCVGNMLISYSDLAIDVRLIDFLIDILLRNQNPKSQLGRHQQWYLFLLLHIMFKKPADFREHLLAIAKYYAFMISLFQTKFQCKIQRKTAVLAIQQILIYQPDKKSRMQLIRYCVSQLKIQLQKYCHKEKHKKIKSKHINNEQDNEMEQSEQGLDKRMRDELEEQRMENEIQKSKDNDAFLFKQFKHPFDKNCQFSMFKQRILAFMGHPQTADSINEQTIPGITQVIQCQWYKNEVRKVFKISK